MRQAIDQSMEKLHGEWTATDSKSSTGVLLEIERRRVVVRLDEALNALRALRADQGFWLSLGPGFRVRYEDFQGDLAAMRVAWRE